jgi:cytochrome d ubiquinol oxidase subunit II
MFSSLYSALMLVLFSLIIRGVSFEFRGKVDSPGWRRLWDTCIFLGSALPALLFGVAFGNIFEGIPIDASHINHGNLFSLLNPYGLLSGGLFVLLFLTHGALWLCIKTEGELQQRASATVKVLWPILLGVAVVFLIATGFFTRLYDNYVAYPALFLVVLITVVGLLGVKLFSLRQQWFKAWFSSALTIVGATFFGVIGLFPALFPSSINAAYSLTAFNASSSPLTLKIMLTVTLIFVPIVLCYQAWAYNLFKGKVTPESLAEEGMY